MVYIDPSVIDGKNLVLFAYRAPDNNLFLLGEKPLEEAQVIRMGKYPVRIDTSGNHFYHRPA